MGNSPIQAQHDRQLGSRLRRVFWILNKGLKGMFSLLEDGFFSPHSALWIPRYAEICSQQAFWDSYRGQQRACRDMDTARSCLDWHSGKHNRCAWRRDCRAARSGIFYWTGQSSSNSTLWIAFSTRKSKGVANLGCLKMKQRSCTRQRIFSTGRLWAHRHQ